MQAGNRLCLGLCGVLSNLTSRTLRAEMADTDKNSLASCLEQQQKGEVKQDQCGLHSQASSGDSVTMEEAQSKKVGDTKGALYECQQVLDPNHFMKKPLDLMLQRIKAKEEKDLKLSLALETHLKRLCSLAAEGIWRRRTLFSEIELQIQGLDNDVITTFLKMGILQKQPSSLCYSFTHLCLQEFFAAMSCILCFNKISGHTEFYSIVQTLKKRYGSHDLFEAPTMRFLFGLLSEKGMRKLQKIFACRLSWETRLYLRGYILEETQHHQSYSLGLLHCLYEMQDKDFVAEVMNNFQETRVHTPVDSGHPVFQTGVKYMVVQTDVDLMVVTFCIKFCHHMKRLQMNAGGQQRKISKAHRIVLSRWTPMTNASWQVLFSMIEFTGSLKELDLSGNPLSNSALQSLCRTLRCPGCHIKTLWLLNCGLTSRHCEDLTSVLKASSSLTELDLQLNDLGDHGVRLLCEGFRNPACKLRILLNPRVMDPTKKLDGEEMGDYLTSFKQQRLQLESPDASNLRAGPVRRKILNSEHPEAARSPSASPGPCTPEHCQHLGKSDTSIHEKRTDIRVLDLFASTRREHWSHTHQEKKKHLLQPPEERMRRGQGKSTSNNRKPKRTPPETRNHTPVRPQHHDADEPEENDLKNIFRKMIEDLKEDMKKSLKEMEEKN
ncbi:NACHT, LRR and PYD domain-containing protein 1 [Cricetulus griseus]|uniref:NACHT, LRR and PYD domain-containing protein 1 n=1 Tax=Cricetulus griseus TaxID=10029 RepID=A0A061I2C1_CRIGR|nr:NACHT, LRR and PYD domain-containing protein 1 [Cricetulus griseus]